MRTGIAVSGLAHAGLLFLGVASFANVEPHVPQEEAAIEIELIPIEEKSNVQLGAKEAEVKPTVAPSPVESEKPKAPEQPAGNAEKIQPKAAVVVKETPAPTVQTAPKPALREATQITPEENPEPESKPEPVKEPDPDPEPVEVAELTEEITAPDEADVPTVAAPKLRLSDSSIAAKRKAYAKQKKADAQKKSDKIAKIINDEKSRGAKKGSGGEKSAGSSTGKASRLTKSERDALAAQMRKCWNPPVAALERDDLFARVIVDLNPNGTVLRTKSVVNGAMTPLETAMGMAAQRAVKRCGPYKLSSAKYDDWKQVDVTFDPKDLR